MSDHNLIGTTSGSMTHGADPLRAMMCDGLGWFDAVGFRRALMTFDAIDYLLPAHGGEFVDTDGSRRSLVYPQHLKERRSFALRSVAEEASAAARIMEAARSDAEDDSFRAAVRRIPSEDQLYTWRIASSDATFGALVQPRPHENAVTLAHALLLNRFLMAADETGSIPIVGKPYVHALVASKMRRIEGHRFPAMPETLSKIEPVAITLVENFVSDDALRGVSEDDILAYKASNAELFRQFTVDLVDLAAKVRALPTDVTFDAALRELSMTEIAKKRSQLSADLRDAWSAFFKGALKSAVGAFLGLGIVPGIPLGGIALLAASASGMWMVPDLADLLSRYQRLRRHGLYYLMHF